jgi:hypothetical protein
MLTALRCRITSRCPVILFRGVSRCVVSMLVDHHLCLWACVGILSVWHKCGLNFMISLRFLAVSKTGRFIGLIWFLNEIWRFIVFQARSTLFLAVTCITHHTVQGLLRPCQVQRHCLSIGDSSTRSEIRLVLIDWTTILALDLRIPIHLNRMVTVIIRVQILILSGLFEIIDVVIYLGVASLGGVHCIFRSIDLRDILILLISSSCGKTFMLACATGTRMRIFTCKLLLRNDGNYISKILALPHLTVSAIIELLHLYFLHNGWIVDEVVDATALFMISILVILGLMWHILHWL